ncbi:triphosphoribosyl-dephospho-CoA synthase [Xanthomonas oryzae pv. oryzicola]|nr:triphosphoribosyl-dephospho-CoA synthase [Xanthomonas oryzae]AKK63823.1 hypothetical protein FE36_08195 [Xanthomonas oryzae pv. oryzicola]OWB25905.1 hypothetical protein XocBAI20_15995 [Xanthomonas oryzae pv. oryzicola]OWB27805.1 hypothetical protein XocBAI21_15165 [Xanthomonas oryzae pv. oryzicola]OWB29362.1 hypothetical protein XocBAI15_04735 [Xanthomonas oryzae pv. oryzicola]PUE97224.1 hypothetical protein C7T79_05900 [Xanthomonas oryzae pv. oryzicola]
MSVSLSPREIAASMTLALAVEAAAFPKPGLVTALDPGVHDDVDFFSFLKSAFAIERFFEEAAEIGQAPQEGPDDAPMRPLRSIGLRAESAMMAATGGSNTHKGAIYFGLLLCHAAAAMGEGASPEAICLRASATAREDAERALRNAAKGEARTVGASAYAAFGMRGARGHVIDGFPIITSVGLPAFEHALASSGNMRRAAVHTLVHVMAENDDTTSLNRGFDASRPSALKAAAAEAVRAGGGMTESGLRSIGELGELCRTLNANPGGSADIVAMTLAVRFWTKGTPTHAKW